MSSKIGIHWFRLDLRLNDNPSLYKISKEVDNIIPIYIYDDSLIAGLASKCWLEKSLEILNKQLNDLNSKLYIFSCDPKKIIAKLINNELITHVFWNRLYDLYSIERDKNIKSFLLNKSIICK